MKVSLVAPIYGVELYVEKFAHTVFLQTMADDIEYIFVNDCTKDESLNILNEIIENYPHLKSHIRIMSNHQNQGLAITRKYGIKDATGEYILCIDSDDWVDKDYVENLYKNAKSHDSDIVVCNIANEYKHRTVNVYPNIHEGIVEDILHDLLTGSLHGSWCNKLIKRSLLANKPIKYPENRCDMMEDLYVIFQLFYFSEKITYEENAFYHYNLKNDSSIISTMSHQKLLSIYKTYEFLRFFVELNYPDNKIMDKYVTEFYIRYLYYVDMYDDDNKMGVDWGKQKCLINRVLTQSYMDFFDRLFVFFRIKNYGNLHKLLSIIKRLKNI